MNNYRELKVWQFGMALTKEVYVLAREFPKYEMYGLSSQTQRAAVSVPANIAEGHARDSTKEFLRHLSIARGSLAELETHLLLAESLDYCDHNRIRPLLEKCTEIGRMLSGLKRSLQAKLARKDR